MSTTPTQSSATGRPAGLAASLGRHNAPKQDLALLAALILLLLGFAVFLPRGSIGLGLFQSMMYQLPELALLSLAMSVAILSGGLNLAIIATANAASLTMATVIMTLVGNGSLEQQVLAIIAGAGAGFIVAVAIGALTGWLVSALKLHPMLVTIGTMSTISGLSVLLTRGGVISGFPPMLLALGNQLFVGVPLSFILTVIVFGGTGLLLSKTTFGVSVRMLGSNPAATIFSGISATRTLVGIYVLSSVLCWIAALVMTSRFNSASAAYGESYLLVTILAAVLGGIDPFGGFGRVTSLFLALLILQVISTGFNVLGFDQHLINAIWGIMLVIVVAGRAGRIWRRSRATYQEE